MKQRFSTVLFVHHGSADSSFSHASGHSSGDRAGEDAYRAAGNADHAADDSAFYRTQESAVESVVPAESAVHLFQFVDIEFFLLVFIFVSPSACRVFLFYFLQELYCSLHL